MKISGDGKVVFGKFTNISPDVEIVFLNQGGNILIGDYCQIGSRVKIIVTSGDIKIDDWTSIHDGCLLLSTRGIKIGQHCWFGQNSVLDGTGGLTIGNSVRVGMYSQLWSHVAAGEQYEGCTLKGEKPIFIHDNVWLVGSCICSPGVTIEKFAVALSQSNITKSIRPFEVVGGSPAVTKPKMNFYQKFTLEQKFNLLKGWLQEFVQIQDDRFFVEFKKRQIHIFNSTQSIKFFCSSLDYEKNKNINKSNENVSVDLERKIYTKKYSTIEKTLFKFLADNKVRFLKDEC